MSYMYVDWIVLLIMNFKHYFKLRFLFIGICNIVATVYSILVLAQ